MKRTDIALIVLIAAFSAGLAYFVASSVFVGMTSEKGEKVQTVDAMTGDIEAPATAVFNENAINPSIRVDINGGEPAATTETGAQTQTGTGANTPSTTDTDSETTP